MDAVCAIAFVDALALLLWIDSKDLVFLRLDWLISPQAEFGCPAVGSVFTYDVSSALTGLPNTMTALGSEGRACRIRSDAWGDYVWSSGLGPGSRPARPNGIWPAAFGRSS